MALEVVLAQGCAEVGPLAALPPEVGQAPFSHQILEPRIGTCAGVDKQPRHVPGTRELASRAVELGAERAECEVAVTQAVRQNDRDFFSAYGSPFQDRQHFRTVGDGGAEVVPPVQQAWNYGTFEQLTKCLSVDVLTCQTAREGQQVGARMVAIERPAALVFGLDFFEPPGCIKVVLLVARDE